ncbi:MAG: gliding motility-associated C-terminal domain-containing protein [Flavobacteriales bacterium]|nr:gliding motility-associated C-terminal domain-containing protein [Flavobacteriales bacterium]
MKKLGLIILLLIGFAKVHAGCATGIVPVPVVDSITVDIAGNVTICWQPIADPDLEFYTIFMVNLGTGANDSIDSVAIGVNCYTIPFGSNNSDNESIQLGVVGVDICNNNSAVGANYHNTMWLNSTFDVCTASASLAWNAYDDFTSGPNVLYSIYVSINAGAYSLAGTTLTTNYIYTGITQGPTYDFYVMAVENVGAGPYSSSSNDVRPPTANALKIPAFNYLYSATVVDSTTINLQFYVDTSADVNSYSIKRALSASGPFTTIGSVGAFNGMNPLVQFTDDTELNANSDFYFYMIETINTCGVSGNPSNFGRTIWLDVISNDLEATNTLIITPYEGWLGNVQTYDVYRSVAGIWESSPVISLSAFSDTMVYVDDITAVFEGDGEYCYKIIATESTVAHVGGLPEATSISNEACTLHEPLLYVPNAFAPTSHYNYEFKPVLTFSDPNSYLFQIYNKWGQRIFETSDVNEAWNGRMHNSGKQCQVDSYVYVIKFLSAKGEEFSKRGVVTLID